MIPMVISDIRRYPRHPCRLPFAISPFVRCLLFTILCDCAPTYIMASTNCLGRARSLMYPAANLAESSCSKKARYSRSIASRMNAFESGQRDHLQVAECHGLWHQFHEHAVGARRMDERDERAVGSWPRLPRRSAARPCSFSARERGADVVHAKRDVMDPGPRFATYFAIGESSAVGSSSSSCAPSPAAGTGSGRARVATRRPPAVHLQAERVAEERRARRGHRDPDVSTRNADVVSSVGPAASTISAPRASARRQSSSTSANVRIRSPAWRSCRAAARTRPARAPPARRAGRIGATAARARGIRRARAGARRACRWCSARNRSIAAISSGTPLPVVASVFTIGGRQAPVRDVSSDSIASIDADRPIGAFTVAPC